MAALNKVMIIGNLGRDPEVRATPQGKKVANFSLAATERYNDAQGQRQEKTEWVNVVVWGRLAEIVEQYVKKGSSLYIEGKLQTQSWEDADGSKKYKTEVLGLNLQMLGGRTQGGEGGGGNSGGGYGGNSGGGYQSPAAPEVIEDDLPF